MKKKRNIYLAIFTLITLLTWVALTVVQSYQKTTVTPDVVQAMSPLNPNIDESVFPNSEQRASRSTVSQ